MSKSYNYNQVRRDNNDRQRGRQQTSSDFVHTPINDELQPTPSTLIEAAESFDEKPNEINKVVKTGVVDGCAQLNVREKPNKESSVIYVIHKADQVIIDEENSTPDFYKVCLSTPSEEGFCMKEFIKIES